MNCSFNIRYKPRTTRAFTKSDLTVYDSAGNTALNALTVYGKSEVVDGSIKSAGEGWTTVDLGTLTWGYTNNRFYASINIKIYNSNELAPLTCSKYPAAMYINQNATYGDKTTSSYAGYIYVKDMSYEGDISTFTTAMSGVLLCYELADPTQGNCIAVKTDDGSGFNGTMATFTTGTPLRATLDGTTRDEMHYNGITGEVITRCEIVNDEVVPLATPIITPLTAQEMTALAGLRTFTPQTHAQNNAGAEMTVDYTIRVPTI